MITKFGKQVYLHDTTEMRLIEHQLSTLLRQDHVKNEKISPLPECQWQPNLAEW